VAAGIGVSALAASMVPAQLTTLGPGHKLPELGTIDLVLLTNPRADRRPAVRALISTVLASGSRSLVAYRDETTEGPTAHPRSLAARRTEDTKGSGLCADWKGCRRKWCG
jgi:hypothetical protein